MRVTLSQLRRIIVAEAKNAISTAERNHVKSLLRYIRGDSPYEGLHDAQDSLEQIKGKLSKADARTVSDAIRYAYRGEVDDVLLADARKALGKLSERVSRTTRRLVETIAPDWRTKILSRYFDDPVKNHDRVYDASRALESLYGNGEINLATHRELDRIIGDAITMRPVRQFSSAELERAREIVSAMTTGHTIAESSVEEELAELEPGDVVDVIGQHGSDYYGVRVDHTFDDADLETETGYGTDSFADGVPFSGPGFLGVTRGGEILAFSVDSVVPGSKAKYYFADGDDLGHRSMAGRAAWDHVERS